MPVWDLFAVAAFGALAGRAWLGYIRLERAITGASDWQAFSARLYGIDLGRPRRWGYLQRRPCELYARFSHAGCEFGVRRLSLHTGFPAYVRAYARRHLAGMDEITVYADPQRPHNNVCIASASHRRTWPLIVASFWSAVAMLAALGLGL